MANRIVLYYSNGKPVYADEVGKTSYDPVGFGKQSDEQDDGKGKGKKKFATRRLVRGDDGIVRVQYVDAKSGKPVKNIKGYEIISASTTPYWGEDYQNKIRKSKDDTEGSGEDEPNPHDTEVRDPSRGQAPPGAASTSTSSATPAATTSQTTAKGTTSATATADVEQGDSVNGATPSDTGFVEGDPQKTGDWTYSNGVNVSSLEGTNLNNIQTATANRADYTDVNRTDMAKTLAGEIDQRQTDLTTEEGRKEAYGILSTMENRALAKGIDVSAAVYAPQQYSTWNNAKVAQTANSNYAAKQGLFDSIVKDYLDDPASRQPYTNYFNPSIVNPGWAKNLTEVKDVGPHRFGVDESIANKIKTAPLDEDQVDSLATDVINKNAAQNFTTPAAKDIIGSLPTELTSQEELNAIENAGMSFGDYIDDTNRNTNLEITSDLTGNSPDYYSDVINAQVAQPGIDQNNWSIDEGKNIASSAPDVPAPASTAANSSFADGVTAQRDYVPSPDMSSMATGLAAQRDVMPTADIEKSGFDSNFISPTVEKSSFNSAYFSPSESRMPSETALGFGDFVDTDTNANSPISGFALDRAEGDINKEVGSPSFPGSQDWAVTAGTDMVSSVPGSLSPTESAPTNTEVGSVPSYSDTTAGPTGEATTGFSVAPDSSSNSVSISTTNNSGFATDYSPEDRDTTSTTTGSGGSTETSSYSGLGDWDGYI